MLNIGKRTVHRHDRVRPGLHFDVCKGIRVNVDNERWYDRVPKSVKKKTREGR